MDEKLTIGEKIKILDITKELVLKTFGNNINDVPEQYRILRDLVAETENKQTA